MIQLLLHVYVFWAWTGSWSSHAGSNSTLFACLWFLIIVLGLIRAIVPSGSLVSSLLKCCGADKKTRMYAQDIADCVSFVVRIVKIVPTLGLAGVATLMYFCGSVDSISNDFPSFMPKSGYLFSNTSIPFYAWIVVIYLGWSYCSLFAKYNKRNTNRED